jgi:hypothetical protein
MRKVILESPFAAPTEDQVERHKTYARACVRDCLMRGESLLYTQPGILDDHRPSERQMGIDAGLAWRTVADASVVYTDLGISKGMQYGIEAAETAGIVVEFRTIGYKPV